ncbi:hypothetical protein PCURB6_19410 [Paenibacillus curdlanolyticus]|nr:hypothetical protein PCURB6_19410 [Paenibacillus curdlanolyticus]
MPKLSTTRIPFDGIMDTHVYELEDVRNDKRKKVVQKTNNLFSAQPIIIETFQILTY